MYWAGDGIITLIFLFVGCLQSEVLGGALPCNASSSGTTFGSGCETTTSPTEKPDDSTENHYCCRSILYVVIIGFGILTLPVIVCTRVCWIKKLRKRQQRRLDDARHRQRETHEQSIYTIAPDLDLNICDFMVSPPPYDVVSTSDEDAPPPYDSPPPYTPKEREKETITNRPD